jgi:hypothetical protein
MVLFCEGLVKIDASSPAFAGLDRDGDVNASTRTALLDGFFERVFQMTQRPGKTAGNFEETMVDGTYFHRHRSILPWSLSSSETRHASSH